MNTLKVIYQVAKQYNVDAQDLIRIATVESRFKVNARRVNTNGTVDYGLFQVNSVHWSTTCKKFDIFTVKGNASCAALILSKIKKSHSLIDSNWIGRYHSKTPSRKLHYVRLLSQVEVKGEF